MSALDIFRLLARALPPRLRREHGAELEEAFEERAREARAAGRSAAALWAFLAWDLAVAAAKGWGWEARRALRPDHGHARGGWIMSFAAFGRDLTRLGRTLRRRPGFAVTAIVTLSLGVGATTTVWSVVDGVLLSPLPYPDAERLVQIGSSFRGPDGAFEEGMGPLAPPDLLDVQRTSETIAAAAASRLERRVLAGEGEPEEVNTAGVSAAYFDVLGVAPELGRAFTAAEDDAAAPAVAVLAHGFWVRRFAADPGVLGRPLVLDGAPFTVVGIMGQGFHPPEAIYHGDVEVWYPLAHVADDVTDRGSFFVQGIGRLAANVDEGAAREELAALGDRISEAYPGTPARRLTLASLHARTVGEVGGTLWVLLGAVGLLLLISCANVAHLFLVRATEREREMAVRSALGAGRGRIAGQLLAEGVALAVAGGALALVLARLGVEAFRRWNAGGVPRLAEVDVDPRVLAFALAVSLVTGFGVSALAAGRSLGRDAHPLRERAAGGGRGAARARGLLVIAQTAVALALFSGAGLLVGSFVRLQRVEPGFDPDAVAWMRVYLGGDAYPAEARMQFHRELAARVAALPGVRAVGGTDNLPLSGNRSLSQVSPEGLALGVDEAPPDVSWHAVLPGTFDALGTRVVSGRDFTDRDDEGAPAVAIVNRAAAALLWPGRDAVGRTFVPGRPDSGAEPVTIVGVVEDVRHQALATPAEPEMYLPALRFSRPLMNLIVRTDGDPAQVLAPVRDIVRQMDPALPVSGMGTLSGHASASLAGPRFHALLASLFAALALAVALVGVYGTLAYAVELRTREMGIRMALGARGRQVMGSVIGRGMALVGAGLIVGLALTWAVAGALERFVFGVTSRDPATLATAAVAFALLGLLACARPALRAARLDPARQLRNE